MESKDELTLEIQEALIHALRLAIRFSQKFGQMPENACFVQFQTSEGSRTVAIDFDAEEPVKRGPARPKKSEGENA